LDDSATELVLTLEKRGDGWGEELFPRASLRRLPVGRHARPAGKADEVR
jgi:hypothetical protein